MKIEQYLIDNEDDCEWCDEYYIMITCSIIANVICVIWDNGLLEKEGEHFGFIDYSGIEVVHPKLVNNLMN